MILARLSRPYENCAYFELLASFAQARFFHAKAIFPLRLRVKFALLTNIWGSIIL